MLESVPSTNTLARTVIEDYFSEQLGPPRFLLVAWEQTRGRGRRGREWRSPAGGGVYATLALPLERSRDLQTLPLLAAVGLCATLDRHTRRRCRLKWPNDLLVAGAKIGGILVESVGRGNRLLAAIVGFGVNRLLPQSPAALPAGGVTALAAECDEPPPLDVLVWELVDGIDRELTRLAEPRYAIARYEELSAHRPGDRIRMHVDDRLVEGVFRGFDERGFLRLEIGGRVRLLTAGDVVAA